MQITIDVLVRILFFYGAIVSALLVMVIAFTPAIAFLIARIMPNKVPLFLIQAGGRIKLVMGTMFGGVFTTKKHGTYREAPGSAYIFKRIATFFAYDNYGSTMPFSYPYALQLLKENGYEIHTYEDLEKLWNDPNERNKIIGFVGGNTISLKDLQYMWPANDNPFINEAKEAIDLAIERKKQGKDLAKIVGYGFLILIVAYVAWSLFKGYGAPAAPVNVLCKFPEQIVNGMSNTAQNVVNGSVSI